MSRPLTVDVAAEDLLREHAMDQGAVLVEEQARQNARVHGESLVLDERRAVQAIRRGEPPLALDDLTWKMEPR